ncbi:hypothetical protein B0A48_12329 [Cryoendolithus antarcticus]|uniref:DUF6924 domain-containing protein n=1 Tax=Cryoendolithus antarcticus TaxID=1507870 RepID=A0A1V8SRS5_9PEZI|nr:hypothetical protein B0A48_12329 [Cryoendolithus antarcticus]
MAGLLFITAPTDLKRLNPALTILRDWEFGDGEYVQKVITTRNAYGLDTPDKALEATEVPLPDDFDNIWTNTSIADIEAYMRDAHRSLNETTYSVNASLFLVLDEEALRKDDIVICHREWSLELDDYEAEFKKTRVPLEHAHAMYANLEVSNMDFESFVEDGEGQGEGGWWTYRPIDGVEIEEDVIAEREAELQRLRGLGFVE